jgi:hypothetical protein
VLNVIQLMEFTLDMTQFLCCIGLMDMPMNWWVHRVTWAPLWMVYLAWTWLGLILGPLEDVEEATCILDGVVPLLM